MSGVSQEASLGIQSINPATREVLECFQQTTAGEIDKTLDSAYAAFLDWRHRPFTERAEQMRNAARILRAGQEKYARTMAQKVARAAAIMKKYAHRYTPLLIARAIPSARFQGATCGLTPSGRAADGSESMRRESDAFKSNREEAAWLRP